MLQDNTETTIVPSHSKQTSGVGGDDLLSYKDANVGAGGPPLTSREYVVRDLLAPPPDGLAH